MNPDGADPSAYYGKWPGHTYFPSPKDWREKAFYHLITDRFRDGDPRNNEGKFGGYNVYEMGSRQGGDFKGIADKLDYIKSLGFDAIWISPIFQNNTNEYHGYGQIDFTLLDDRFGTLKDFRHLVTEAHKRQMYVIVDIVVNHMGDLLYAKDSKESFTPFRFHTGEYDLYYREPALTYSDFHIENYFDPEGQYPAVYNQKGKLVTDTGKGSYWKSDFHHNGGLTDYHDPWSRHLGKIYDKYDDLRTTHVRVQKKIAAMTKALISSTDIDGIRMDTPMQVPISFFEYWLPDVRTHAEKLGKKNFLFFAELYCSTEFAATLLGRGRDNTQYAKDEYLRDNALFDGGIDYLTYKNVYEALLLHNLSHPLDRMLDTYSNEFDKYDFLHEESGKIRYRNFHFFDGHDQRRIAMFPNGIEKLKLATALMAAWPGVPMFYYGDEQGLSSYGAGLEGHTREPMMHSIAWRNHPAAHMPNIATKDNFDMASDLYLYVQRAMNVRKAYPVLQKGDKLRGLYEKKLRDGYVLSFERMSEASQKRALVVLNTSGEAHTFKLELASDGNWQDALSGKLFSKEVDSDYVTLSLDAYSALILVPESEYIPVVSFVTDIVPEHDEILLDTGRHTDIRITFDKPVDELSLRNKILLNGRILSVGSMKILEGGSLLEIPRPKAKGLYVLNILAGVADRDGNVLPVSFSSRFFVLSAKERLLHESDFYADALMIDEGRPIAFSLPLKARHHAYGSSYFRMLENGQWGEWQKYAADSLLRPKGAGWKDYRFQYWIDGSTAYFAGDGIDAYGYDGFGVDWKKSPSLRNQVQQTPES